MKTCWATIGISPVETKIYNRFLFGITGKNKNIRRSVKNNNDDDDDKNRESNTQKSKGP